MASSPTKLGKKVINPPQDFLTNELTNQLID
jgi:hypothetical protein